MILAVIILKIPATCNKNLEHVTDHSIISIVIGQLACCAHQNRGFWWAKQEH